MVAPDGDHPSETTPHTLPLARLLRIGIRCTIHAQKPQLEQIIGHCPKNQSKPIHKVAQFFIFFFYILKIKFYIKKSAGFTVFTYFGKISGEVQTIFKSLT
jgi:hypothetical protein